MNDQLKHTINTLIEDSKYFKIGKYSKICTVKDLLIYIEKLKKAKQHLECECWQQYFKSCEQLKQYLMINNLENELVENLLK